MTTDPMRTAFEHAAAAACSALRGDELVTLWLEAEDSQFVRINRARLRQAGGARRAQLTLRLVDGRRQAFETRVLAGDTAHDARLVREAMDALRAAVADAGDDPHLLVARGAASSATAPAEHAPDALEIAERASAAADGLDLVGFVVSGPVWRGFASASAAGPEAFHWFGTAAAVLDCSIYRAPDRAVKTSLAGAALGAAPVAAAIERAARVAEWLERPVVEVSPGRHRALLEPAAAAELLSMFQWDGFSLRALRTRNSPLAKFHDGQARFDPRLSLDDAPAAGGAPRFQADGFLGPPRTPLIDAGAPASLLVSPRSEREFGVPSNGAPSSEMPGSLRLAAGDLPEDDALRALDTGLWIGNLWYLNWSDRAGARVTGMTRFATFWVERGRVVGPVAPLRFDDSLYRLLGDGLEALGADPQVLPDTSTYDGRALGSITTPALLLRSLAVTL